MTSSFPPPSTDHQPGARLTGWKEIAAYLGRGVRTVQRWEKTLGLPVRRLETGKAEIVHAFVAELDAWFAANSGQREVADRSDDSVPDEPLTKEVRPTNGRERLPDPQPAVSSAGRPAPRGRRRAILSTVVVVVAIVVFTVWRALPVPQPAKIKIDHDTLRAYDSDGRVLWTRTFAVPLVPPGYDDEKGAMSGRTVLEDIDGDGLREVVLFTASKSKDVYDELRAFDARGNDLWSRAPGRSVRFGDTDYAPPWVGYRMFVQQDGARRRLWVAWIHHESGEFPCLLERLSATTGKPENEYWSAGYVESVTPAVVAGVPSILVGAGDNNHRAASLAVFDAGQVRGSSPAETADKTCRNCTAGRPKVFLLFPRMELLRRFQGIPGVVEVRQAATGEMRVRVNQAAPDRDGTILPGCVLYQLSPDGTPLGAEVCAEYIASHDILYHTGQLDHPFGAPDMAEAWPVLRWTGGPFVPVTGTTRR